MKHIIGPILCGLAVSLMIHEAYGAPFHSSQQGSGEGLWIYNISDDFYKEYDNYDTFKNSRDPNDTAFINYDSGQNYDETGVSYIVPDDYGFYDSLDICSSDVLIASDEVKILSPASLSSDVKREQWNHWTIVPSYTGGAVTVTKRGNVVSRNVFLGGCSDVQIFQSMRSGANSRSEWCHEKRLVPCDSDLQMAYHIFGYSPTSEPSKGIDVVYIPNDVNYNYDADEKAFSMYYYECGGRRMRGDIRSPVFPEELLPYEGSVSCKWELEVSKSVDYGIIRFSGFHLPFCDHHHLKIEEDTIINEGDVTDSLIKMLQERGRHENTTEQQSVTDRRIHEYDNSVNGSRVKELANDSVAVTDDENKEAYFYRDSKMTEEDIARNPKGGIHVVVITKYCGELEPKRTFSWRRGSKNITLTFVSEQFRLRNYGFEAKFSSFSWEDTMRQHRSYSVETFRTPPATVSHVIFNYIILIVFVPIGLTIGLSIIIFHIKRRGPTLHEFYRKEKKELRLRRSNTERVKSFSPRVHRPARRAQSLDITLSNPNRSEIAESGILMPHRKGRKGSLSSVRFLITRKKPSIRLPTMVEEDDTSLAKTNRTSTTIVKKKLINQGIS